VILREEEPVVEKRVVPRDRVRLDKDTVTDEERVDEQVRKEQIDVHDGDTTGGRRERRRRR
jgi:stress response protein YsnF